MRRSLHTLVIFVLLAASLPAQPARSSGGDTTYIQWDAPLQISFGPYDAGVPQIVAVGDTLHLAWTTNNGPHALYARSTDRGSLWSTPIVLVETTWVTGGASFTAAGSYVYLFSNRCNPPCNPNTYQYVVDLTRSVNAGLTWLPRVTIASEPPNSANYSGYSSARDSTVGFINMRGGQPSRLGWSWDTGMQWNFYNYNTGPSVFDRFVILSNGIHVARWLSGIGLPRAEIGYLYSNNFGQTWTPYAFLSTPDSILSDQPDIAGDNSGNLHAVWRDFKYGGIDYGTILYRRSTNFGVTWISEEQLTYAPTGLFPKIATDDAFVVAIWNDPSEDVVLRLSANHGEVFLPPETIGAGHWGSLGLGLSLPWIHVAYRHQPQASDTAQIFYRRGRIVITQVQDEAATPFTCFLSQNYPNPFNPATTISFALPTQATVRLKIFNVLGQEVTTLVDAVRPAGYYDVQWDRTASRGDALASGVYVYRLEATMADGKTVNSFKRMLLLK